MAEQQQPRQGLAQINADIGQRMPAGGTGTGEQSDMGLLRGDLARLHDEIGKLRADVTREVEGVRTEYRGINGMLSDIYARLEAVERLPPAVFIIPRESLYEAGDLEDSFDRIIGHVTAVGVCRQMVDDLLRNMSSAVKSTVFYGGRGVGKTMMARAFAKEVGWHFVPCHVLDSKHLLLSTSRLKVSMTSLFSSVIKADECVVELNGYELLDENQLHNELSDLRQKNLKLFVIGTTSNFAQIDESAPFERAIALSPPSRSERIQLFRAFLNGHDASLDDVSLATLADRTCRLSGLALKFIVNAACRQLERPITLDIVDEARMDFLSGSSTPLSVFMSFIDRVLTAVHEVGHGLYSLLDIDADKMDFLTTKRCYNSLGLAVSLPENEPEAMTARKIKARICVLLAGRVAEEMFNDGEATLGCTSDAEKADELARAYVKAGFSPAGQLPGDQHGPESKDIIDNAVKVLLDQMLWKVREKLALCVVQIQNIAMELLEEHQVTRDQVEKMLEQSWVRIEKKPAVSGGAEEEAYIDQNQNVPHESYMRDQ